MTPWWPHLFSWPRFLDPISWWWLSVKGYAFTSSGLQLTIPAALVVYWRRHNCHHKLCPWLTWHPDPDTGHPVCRNHHPDPHGYLDGTATKPTK